LQIIVVWGWWCFLFCWVNSSMLTLPLSAVAHHCSPLLTRFLPSPHPY
jgi:hypothetical protein